MDILGVLDLPETRANRELKMYLSRFCKQESTEENLFKRLGKVVLTYECEKFGIHLFLFCHLDIPEVRRISDDPNIPFDYCKPEDYPGISSNVYCRLINHLDLHEQFLQMVSALHCHDFCRKLLEQMLGLVFFNGEQKKRLNQHELRLWKCYILMIAKMSKGCLSMNFLVPLIQRLATEFTNNNGVAKYEKIVLLLKIAGIVSLNEEDYTGGSEISELVSSWSFDDTENLPHLWCQAFKVFYNVQPTEVEVPKKVLEFVGVMLESDMLTHTKTDEMMWKKLKLPQLGLSWLEYVGACNHLVQLILNKKKDSIGDVGQRILDSTVHLEQFKPKIEESDFRGEIKDFKHFCSLMKTHGLAERYQKKWFERFLTYPEALTAPEGIAVADSIVAPNADAEIAFGLLMKALDCASSLINSTKDIILKMLSYNAKVIPERDNFIAKIFPFKGENVHTLLAKKTFHTELNALCCKIRTIETNVDSGKDIYWKNTVFKVCVQNPLIAVDKIVKQCIRSQQFKCLRIAKKFLEIVYSTNGNISILEHVLEEDLHDMDYLNPQMEALKNSFPVLLNEKFLTFPQLYSILQKVFERTIEKQLPLKLSKIFILIKELVTCGLGAVLISESESEEIRVFFTRVLYFTSQENNSNMLQTLPVIREHCFKILCVLKAHFTATSIIPSTDYKSLKLIEIGFLYVRAEEYRKLIENHVLESKCQSISYTTLVQSTVMLILHTCQEEWNTLLQFVMGVLLKHSEDWQELSPLFLLNDCLLFDCAQSENAVAALNHVMQFYDMFLKKLFVHSERFKTLEQRSVIGTLVTVSQKFEDVDEDGNSQNAIVQMVLVQILNLLDWMVVVVPEDEFEDMTEYLLDAVKRIPMRPTGPCVPVHKSIISRILLKDKAPMMPITDKLVDSDASFKDYLKNMASITEEHMTKFVVSEKDIDRLDLFSSDMNYD